MGEPETGLVITSTLYDINHDAMAMCFSFAGCTKLGLADYTRRYKAGSLNEALDSNVFHYSSLVDIIHIFECMVIEMEICVVLIETKLPVLIKNFCFQILIILLLFPVLSNIFTCSTVLYAFCQIVE